MMNGKMLKNEPVSIQRTMDVNRRFGTHECVPLYTLAHIPLGELAKRHLYSFAVTQSVLPFHVTILLYFLKSRNLILTVRPYSS